MISVCERAIEDWLTKASERSYQTAFCHLLNAMGYTVIHSTTHGPCEDGKDVIAQKDNKYFAFQLKRGNLTVNSFRSIEGEIIELVEHPIRHPSVQAGGQHIPVLVTTGNIHEHVSDRIRSRNDGWRSRGYNELKTWAGNQALKKFINHSGNFLPVPIHDFHRFLAFMIKDGHSFIDKDEFALLLESILPVKSKAETIHLNSYFLAAPIITEYVLDGYDRVDNHFAKIEAYIILWHYIRAYAIKYNIIKSRYKQTESLIIDAIDQTTKLLFEETYKIYNDNDYFPIDPLYENVIHTYRSILLAGIFSSHWLGHCIGRRSGWIDEKKEECRQLIFKLARNFRHIPSETYIPACFLASLFLRHNGYIHEGDTLFKYIIGISVHFKINKSPKIHLREPYYSYEKSIKQYLGIPDFDALNQEIEISRNSYTLWPLLLIAARRLHRQFLNGLWGNVTEIHFSKYKSKKNYQYLLWNNEKEGTLIQNVVPIPTSWKRLKEESKEQNIPNYFRGYEHWIPYYLFAYPHRFSSNIVLGMEKLFLRKKYNIDLDSDI